MAARDGAGGGEGSGGGGGRPPPAAVSGGGWLWGEAVVEGLAVLGHLAQQLRAGEAGAVSFGQRVAALGRVGGAEDVEPRERTAGPGREAPAEDGAHVALADVVEHAFLERAHRFQRLHEEQTVLHLGQRGLRVCDRVFRLETLPEAL